ncbi:hypothetical protein LSH36_969g00011 [Paralvinella palmiformis]|uniref:Diphthine--ammonia ligase n=1 Tax=Paralvinella palmiformis TaxID=53620 RepID=A0AAD9IXY0_9ANNE|nr:hypothetical protein LSH36_969g00011 [Paralvinella palmiformis]
MQCVREGHELVALANLRPKEKDELDSYMYQTVGHHAVDLYAEAMELPLYRRTIEGSSLSQGKDYQLTSNDEVEDLYQLLKQVKERQLIEAVSVGAIMSDYQRVRVEHVCQRLNLTVLAFLWRRDQVELLHEIIQCGVKAIIIKVAALGLDPDKHLGLTLEEIYPHMIKMQRQYGLNVCGEGGEYETFTLDCPLFKKKIIADEVVTVTHSDDAFAPVAFLNFSKLHLESKDSMETKDDVLYEDFLGEGVAETDDVADNNDYTDYIDYSPATHEILLVLLNQKELVSNLPMKHSGQLLFEVMQTNDVIPSTDQGDLLHVLLRSTSKVSTETLQTYLSKKYLNISGIMALKSESESIEFDVYAAMEKLKDLVGQHQRSSSDVLAVYMYVRDMTSFCHINNAYKRYFENNPPVRVCVEACLPQNAVLQIDCVCNLTEPETEINTMHVQSLSHWAPANIGPYSQAKKIGLCPVNLTIIAGGIIPETRLSLRHVARILAAMTTNSGLYDIVTAICYVTNQKDIPTVEQQLNNYYEEQLKGSDNGRMLPFSVLYVVVPSLPKSALIEWQVYAVTGWSNQWQEWSSVENSENYVCQLTMFASETAKDRNVSFIVSVELVSDSSCSINVNDITLEAVEGVLQILKRVSETASPLRVLRVFYRGDLFTANEISQAFHAQISDCFQWLEGNLPAATFIPVLAFRCDTTLLCVYH